MLHLWPQVPSFAGTAHAPLAVGLSFTKVKGFSTRRSWGKFSGCFTGQNKWSVIGSYRVLVQETCHWVVWLPCCRLSRAVLRSRRRSLSWMLISAQPLDNWGRRLSSWLAKSKAFPGILGTCPLLKDAQMKSHFCAIYSAHGGPQYCLLDTINSWSSGWEFISRVEREWYLQNF